MGNCIRAQDEGGKQEKLDFKASPLREAGNESKLDSFPVNIAAGEFLKKVPLLAKKTQGGRVSQARWCHVSHELPCGRQGFFRRR